MGSASSVRRPSDNIFDTVNSFTKRRERKQNVYLANGGNSFYSRPKGPGGISFFSRSTSSNSPLDESHDSTIGQIPEECQADGSLVSSGGNSGRSKGDKPQFFVFRSQRYNTYNAFMSAVARETPKTPPTAKELRTITKEKLVARVHTLFHEYVDDVEEPEITASDFGGLAASVAAGLGMDPDRFRSLGDAFDRFDADGDGLLDESECLMLAESMLRYYIDSVHPRRPGQANSLDLDVKQLEQYYALGKRLGRGGQGIVHLATEIQGMTQRVVKIFDKSNANAPLEEIKEEFKLLRNLDHPRIQRLYDIFEDRSHVYIISEPYFGGHLGHLVEQAFEAGVHISVTYIAKALHQVLQAMIYLHSKYVTHCDVKDQNVMVVDCDDLRDPQLVVIDFGLAHCFAERGSSGGTPGYMPPEVWNKGLWAPKGDVFSCGVLFFQMYSSGARCFPACSEEEIIRVTCTKEPDYEIITDAWRRIDDIVPLLKGMLKKEPHKRPTAKVCSEDPFFTKRVKPRLEDYDPDEEVVPYEVIESLQSVSKRSRLQKAVQADLAGRQNLTALKNLNAAFDRMDVDHDGVLTAEEVRTAMRHEGLADEDVEQVVQNLVGADGQVAYTLFMGSLVAEKELDEGRILLREFEALDLDQTGYLEEKEAALLLKKPALAEIVGGRDAEEMMQLMDLDGDGRVVFEEFRRVLSGEEAANEPQVDEWWH